MTLLITAVTRDTIYQTADFRLSRTIGRQVRTVSDTSTKIVALQMEGWSGFVTYTGIGRDGIRDTSDILLRWLTGAEGSPTEIADIIRARGTEWLKRLGYPRHTFLLVASSLRGNEIFKISNFEDLRGRCDATAASHLTVFREWPTVGLYVCGQRDSVAKPLLLRLRNALRTETNPAAIRHLLSHANATASALSAGTVSRECAVYSTARDGSGQLHFDGIAQPKFLMLGSAMPGLDTILRQIGFSGVPVSGAMSRSGPRLPARPCAPVIVAPDQQCPWTVEEVTIPNATSVRLLSIASAGHIAGAAQLNGNALDSPLSLPIDRRIDVLSGTGQAEGVWEEVVVGKIWASTNVDHAFLWRGPGARDLGTFRGTDSGATCIAGDYIGGWVCIDAVNRGQNNFRPARWTISTGELHVLEDLPCNGAQCVDIIPNGTVLVVGYNQPSTLPMIWRPQDNALGIVGGVQGIYPIAINPSGTILGKGNDENARSTALLWDGTRWHRLADLPVDSYGSDIGESGEIVGSTLIDGFSRPWHRSADGVLTWLPYFRDHYTRPAAISNGGTIVGNAVTDHGSHGLIWTRR